MIGVLFRRQPACISSEALDQGHQSIEKDHLVNEVFCRATEGCVCHQIYSAAPPDSLQQQWGGDWSKLHSSCQPSDYLQPPHIVSTAPSLTHVCNMSTFLSPASQQGFYLCVIFALLAVLRNNSPACPSGNKILGALIVYITWYRNSKSHHPVVKKPHYVLLFGEAGETACRKMELCILLATSREITSYLHGNRQHTWWTLILLKYSSIIMSMHFLPDKCVHQEEKEPEMCVNKYI